MGRDVTEGPAEMPDTIPFLRGDDPELRIFATFDVGGEPHHLTVQVWGDDRYELSLVSLTSGRRCHWLSAAEVSALAGRGPHSAAR